MHPPHVHAQNRDRSRLSHASSPGTLRIASALTCGIWCRRIAVRWVRGDGVGSLQRRRSRHPDRPHPAEPRGSSTGHRVPARTVREEPWRGALQEIRRCRTMTSKPFGVNLTILPALIPADYDGYAKAPTTAQHAHAACALLTRRAREGTVRRLHAAGDCCCLSQGVHCAVVLYVVRCKLRVAQS